MELVNQVLSAVSATLFDAFGCEIYRQPVEQGYETPCFFLFADNLREKRYIGGRTLHAFRVTAEYLPPEDGQRREAALEASGRLFRLLDRIRTEAGDFLCCNKQAEFGVVARGFSRGFEVSDELLRFTFTIQYFTADGGDDDAPAVPMEKLIMKGENR